MKKIYTLLILCCLNYAAFATKYFPSSITAPYAGATQTVCIGSLNTATTVTYAVCGTTSTGTALSVTPSWYFNGTLVATSAAFNAVSGGGTVTLAAGTVSFSTAGTYTGTNGLYCVLTWTTAAPGACSASLTVSGATTNVTVTATPAAITGPTAVCTGSSISLSDATAGGTWTSGSPTLATVVLGTGVVTGALAGTPIISYNIGGCTVTSAVTVSTTPAAISGAASVCATTTITLSDATTGGTWTSSNTTIATVGSTSRIVTGVAGGAVIITYTTGGGCAAIKPVSVVAVPVAISGLNAVCKGLTITLSDASAGGTWTSATTTIATIGSLTGIVTGVLSPGNSLISYSNGCGAAATLTVTVNPLPAAITGITSVCAGSSVSLSDTTPGGAWGSSNTALATTAANSVYGASAGIPTITYTLPTTCISTTTLIVIAAPAAIIGPTALCYGLTIALSDASTSGTWSSSNTAIATISGSRVVTGSSVGTAIISYSNGCGSAATTNLSVNPLPLPITGTLSSCPFIGFTLSDANTGGAWSTGNTTIATVSSLSGVVTGFAGGTAPITYTLPTTCLITTTVTILPPPTAISGSQHVCVGKATTLSDVTAGGIWTSSNTTLATIGTSSGVVTGIAFGTPGISYTIPSGCIAIMTLTVNPSASITGADSICNGSTTYLADIVGGGTWSSAITSIAIIGSVNGFVTGLSTGVSPVTYTTPGGCISTTSVSVIALPPAITGATNTCPGATTTLHDATGGGLWSSSNNSVATVSSSSGTVHGVFADTTTITYTVLPGCAVSTTVIVNPLPATITGNSALCATTNDTLHDASPGGTWSTTTTALATVVSSSGVATVLAGGNAVIVYTLPITGCKITDTLLVHPLPIPVVLYNWGTASFYVNNDYVSYQWYDSLQGLIPGATSATLAALYTGYYYVVVTDSFGCTGTSPLYEFNAAILGVTDPLTELIKIYPNPANAVVYIASPLRVRAVIKSIDGKKQLEQADAKELNISSFANGMYFITLYNDDQQVITTRKLIKQ